MAAVMEFVIGALTAVCTSLIVVVLLWRLSRYFSFRRATPPPCCDVTDLLTWLLDACQALMGAAILVLVVSVDLTCAVAGFLALLSGAQTLCLLATRGVVMATGHVLSRDDKCDGNSKLSNQRCSTALYLPLLIIQLSIVTVLCALPLSELPIARMESPQNHSAFHHLTCLPLTLESRDTAAWGYTCFLLVAVGWIPLLVAMVTGVISYWCGAYKRKVFRPRSVALSFTGALRLTVWTLVMALLSVEVSTAPQPSAVAEVELAVVFSVDAALLIHVLHDVLSLHQSYVSSTRQQQHQLPARLTAVTRAQRQLVRFIVLR